MALLCSWYSTSFFYIHAHLSILYLLYHWVYVVVFDLLTTAVVTPGCWHRKLVSVTLWWKWLLYLLTVLGNRLWATCGYCASLCVVRLCVCLCCDTVELKILLKHLLKQFVQQESSSKVTYPQPYYMSFSVLWSQLESTMLNHLYDEQCQAQYNFFWKKYEETLPNNGYQLLTIPVFIHSKAFWLSSQWYLWIIFIQ